MNGRTFGLVAAGVAVISGSWIFDVSMTSKIAPLKVADASACGIGAGALGTFSTTPGAGAVEAEGVRRRFGEVSWIVGPDRLRFA